MSKRHLKNINAPKSWPIQRKKKYWIIRTNPGPHSFKESMPLGVIFNDLLGYTRTTREIKRVLLQGVITVNGKVRKDHKFPVGIFDIIEFPEDEAYRLLYDLKGRFFLKKEDKNERKVILFKIKNKTILKEGKIQLNLGNGENILTDKKDIKPGDTITISDNKVKDILSFDKGVYIYLVKGKRIGTSGRVENVAKEKIKFSEGKEKYETLKKYAFVIGKDKPLINIK